MANKYASLGDAISNLGRNLWFPWFEKRKNHRDYFSKGQTTQYKPQLVEK